MKKINGGKVGSIKALRKSVKGGGDYAMKRIPANGSLVVRFMTEPEEWTKYKEYYKKDVGFFPDFEGLDPDIIEELDRPSLRYAAAAVDTQENKAITLVMPKSLVEQLLKSYDKHSTIMDRDYELSKEGEGMQGTKYYSMPESPTKFNLRRYEMPDVDDALQRSIPDEVSGESVEDDDLDDDLDMDDEKPIRRSRTATTKTRPTRRRRAVEDDDDEEDVEETPVRRKRPGTSTTKTRPKPGGLRRRK